MKQRSVTILGMHRSGTSLVAGVLKHLGVDMGEPDPPIILWDNPLGQTEDANFVVLDDLILKAAGGSWDKPPSHEAIMAQKDEFNDKIKLAIGNRKSPIWGWKTARNCLTIELYLPHLPDSSFIACWRHIGEIAASLERRNKMSTGTAEELTKIYNKRLHDILNRCIPGPHLYEVRYECVSKNKVEFVDNLTDFLGLRVTSDMRNRAIESILSRRAVRELSDNMKAMDDIKLNIGCGSAKKDGWIGIDIRPLDGVDVVWDLTKFPWPFANDSCNEMEMDQVWEIIEPKYRVRLMDELWRIAGVGCRLTVRAPHATTFGAAQDPLHYGCPNEATFWYFDPRHPLYAEYLPLPWTIVEHGMSACNVVAIMSPMKEKK